MEWTDIGILQMNTWNQYNTCGNRDIKIESNMATAREIIEALPQKVVPEAIEGHETNFHFDLEGEGGGEMTVRIKDGEVTFEEGLHGEPKCTVRGKAENFVKLAQGELNPFMAIMTGKVKISNQGEMIKYAKIFGLM